jgi:hypothetical protein
MQKTTIVFPECFTRDTKAAMIGTAASTSRVVREPDARANRIVRRWQENVPRMNFGYAPAVLIQARRTAIKQRPI